MNVVLVTMPPANSFRYFERGTGCLMSLVLVVTLVSILGPFCGFQMTIKCVSIDPYLPLKRT